MVGLLWGAMTGQWELALKLAVFFELIWLDLLPVGTCIVPNGTAPMLLCLAAGESFGLQSAEEMALPMLLSLPAACMSAKLEHIQRWRQDRVYNKALSWGRGEGQHAEGVAPFGGMIARAMLEQVVMQTLFFLGALFVFMLTISLLSAVLGHIPRVTGLSWAMVWFTGALGGVLAVRVMHAYVVFILMFCLLLGYAILHRFFCAVPWSAA